MTRDFLADVPRYEQEKILGIGSFSVVVKAADRKHGRMPVAIKLLARGPALRDWSSYVQREIENQVQLRHPLVVEVSEVFLTSRYLAIVMEYARGGDLYTYISRLPYGRLPEDHAKALFQQLILGLDFCHRRGISSRDLKLENLLLDRDGSDGNRPLLKICDFGFSKNETMSPARSNGVGTPVYMAPEVIHNEQYDGKKADIWSCAVILYAIIFGRYPFDDKDKCLREKITASRYTMPQVPSISEECKDIIQRMLVVNPDHRIKMHEIKLHPFFRDGLPEGAFGMNDALLRELPYKTDEEWQLMRQNIRKLVLKATTLSRR